MDILMGCKLNIKWISVLRADSITKRLFSFGQLFTQPRLVSCETTNIVGIIMIMVKGKVKTINFRTAQATGKQ